MNTNKPRYPSTIHLYPSMTCQLKCSYCYVNDVNLDRTVLPLEVYRTLLEEAKLLGVQTVDIAGGEPLTYQRIKELLEIIHTFRMNAKLVTNGLFLDRYYEYFRKNRNVISELHISLDSHKEEVQDRIRSYQGLFRIVTANIQNYVRENMFPIIINYVLHQDNYRDLSDFLDFIHNLGVKGIHIQYVIDVSEKTKQKNYSMELKELYACLQKVTDWKNRREDPEFEVLVAVPNYLYPLIRKDEELFQGTRGVNMVYIHGLIHNNAFKEAIIIKNNGDVTGSTSFINRQDWVIGNIKEKSLQEIWDTGSPQAIKKIQQWGKERVETGVCRDCIAKRYCKGGDIAEVVDQGDCCDYKSMLEELTERRV